MYTWYFEHGSYYLKDEHDRILNMCDRIGLCYSKGEMWTVHKHGKPEMVKKYCIDVNARMEAHGLLKEWPDMRHYYKELHPLGGELLDLFNHTLQCTGRIKTYLLEEYQDTIELYSGDIEVTKEK